jgi:photosystem II stability/assembly factor-like uncharacterized protein
MRAGLRLLAWVGPAALVVGCASSSHLGVGRSPAASAPSSSAQDDHSFVATPRLLPPVPVSSSPSSAPASSSSPPADVGRPSVDPQSVSFVSASTGWVWGPGGSSAQQGYGPGTLAKTTDGGKTWQTLPTPGINYGQYGEPIGTGVTAVRFADNQHGYLYGDQLFVTSDGGLTWQQQQPPGPIEDIEATAGSVYAKVRDCATPSECAAAQTSTARLYEVSSDGARFTLVGPPDQVSDDSQLLTYGGSMFLLAPDMTVPGSTTLWIHRPDSSWQHQSTPCDWSGADFGAMAAWSANGLALVCGLPPGAGNQLKVAYASTDAGSHWDEVAPLTNSGGYVAGLAVSDATPGSLPWPVAHC